MNDLESMAFPKKSWVKQKKKRKKHPKSILHGKQSGFCYLCALLNGDYSMKQTEEHHVVFGAGQRSLSEEYGLKVYLCRENRPRGAICTAQ